MSAKHPGTYSTRMPEVRQCMQVEASRLCSCSGEGMLLANAFSTKTHVKGFVRTDLGQETSGLDSRLRPSSVYVLDMRVANTALLSLKQCLSDGRGMPQRFAHPRRLCIMVF